MPSAFETNIHNIRYLNSRLTCTRWHTSCSKLMAPRSYRSSWLTALRNWLSPTNQVVVPGECTQYLHSGLTLPSVFEPRSARARARPDPGRARACETSPDGFWYIKTIIRPSQTVVGSNGLEATRQGCVPEVAGSILALGITCEHTLRLFF